MGSAPCRVAAIVTTFFPTSHASALVPKFLRGFPTDDGLVSPRTQLASLYIDQIHAEDIGLQLAHEYEVPVFESIRAALTLGTGELAVDAVLLIGEHGDYPVSSLGQEMLPRRYFFEQICGVIAETGRPIPIFNDKYLAYCWEDARWMYETARSLQIPLWAGSSTLMAWRRPQWDHPLNQPIDAALAIGFHMLERYGFHGLEVLQSSVERRRGGETGVRAVQCLSGSAVWKDERWSRQLADRALESIEGGPGKLDPGQVEDPHLFFVEYCDGFTGTVLMLGDNGYVSKFAYAQQSGESIDAVEYHGDSGPSIALFSYQGLNIEDFFMSGIPPTPVERTYLTTGILEAVMISHGSGGTRVETPHLENIAYSPSDGGCRPRAERPSGASVEPWPLPEPGATPTAKSVPITLDGTVHGS
jgi:hypothetical protein